MVITSKKGEKKQLERKVTISLAALAALVMMCFASQHAGYPMLNLAFAQADQDSSLLRQMLNSSHGVADAEMAELQSMGIPIPSDVIVLYSSATKEKTLAIESIEAGDLESAKVHTLSSMTLFKQTADLANSYDIIQIKNQKEVINERLVELQNDMVELKEIINTNKLSFATNRDVDEFDKSFGLATIAIFQRNYYDAEKQISRCETMLDSVHEKIHNEIEISDRSDRAMVFADTLADRLEQLINEAREGGVSEEDLIELENQRQMILDQLKITDDFESIIGLADQLIDREFKVQVMIGELKKPSQDQPTKEPVKDEPVDDGPSGGGSNNDSPLPDEIPTYDPSKFDEEYLQLQAEIAELKAKVESVGLTFPTQDTDQMLANFKQHADAGEHEDATQAMNELYGYLSMIHEVKGSYVTVASKLASVTEMAEGLEERITELGYMQFIPSIEESQALISDAESKLALVEAEDSLSHSQIDSAIERVDLAYDLTIQAKTHLLETEASLEQFITEVEETMELIEQQEARADEIEDDMPNILSSLIDDILGLLDQARASLSNARESLEVGELQQAQEQLAEATSLLDTAEDLLTELLDLPLL